MDDDDCLAFWHQNKPHLNKLVYQAISLPAASSATERVLANVVLF